jgi:hypothetical protein
MHRITGQPDNLAFFIYVIRPDSGFDLPDIQPDIETAGYPAN